MNSIRFSQKGPISRNTSRVRILGCFLFLFALLLSSCEEKKGTPEDALTEYINYRLSGNQDKEGVLKRLTGPILEKVSAMTEDDFKIFMETSEHRKKKLEIVNKNCEQFKCNITYVLRYSTVEDEKEAFVSEVRKLAEMRFENGLWKIHEISNLKTFHRINAPIDVMNP